jgi:hypothetical protein
MPLPQLYSESAVCKDHSRTSKKPSGAKDLRLPMTKHRAIRNALAHMSQVENMPKVLFCDPILASPKCFVLTICNDSPVSCVKSLNPNQPHTFLANPSHFLGSWSSTICTVDFRETRSAFSWSAGRHGVRGGSGGRSGNVSDPRSGASGLDRRSLRCRDRKRLVNVLSP